MKDIPPDLAGNAVTSFLDSQISKKTETEQKQLEKAQANSDLDKIASLNKKIEETRLKYDASVWLDAAANKMAKQIKFGTHISKGIHPDSKGDNVVFHKDTHPADTLAGSHSIDVSYTDANGNAAALPLAAFFEHAITDHVTVRDLVLSDNKHFIDSLSEDENIAATYHQAFKDALLNTITSPSSHERNKQLLWPTNTDTANNVDELNYHNIVPLYPSVLTHEVYKAINQIKYGEENKAARDRRKKNRGEQSAYTTLSNTAQINLGGTKPQNISLLTSRQGGRSYLLPSLPPVMQRTYRFNLSKAAKTIFSKQLEYQCRDALTEFAGTATIQANNVHIRNSRKFAIDRIIHTLFSVAQDIQSNQAAGWSIASNLDYSQQLWLDPQRSDLEDQVDFNTDRLTINWHSDIVHQFSIWINAFVMREVPALKTAIGDSEHLEWQREIEAMASMYHRAGKGVFL